MKKTVFTTVAGLLSLLAAAFVGADALVPLPQKFQGARLLLLAVGAVACSLLLGLYLALKVIMAAVGKFPNPGGMPNLSNLPRAAHLTPPTADPVVPQVPAHAPARSPAAPGSASANPAPAQVAGPCQIMKLPDRTRGQIYTCARCRINVAIYTCGLHAAVLCGGCLSEHISEVA